VCSCLCLCVRVCILSLTCPHQTGQWKALEQLVASDLEHGFYSGLAPPSQTPCLHSGVLGELTLLRSNFTRADIEAGDYVRDHGVFAEFQELLNGDFRVPYIQHYRITARAARGSSEALLSGVL
jgi:hypothetical protein